MTNNRIKRLMGIAILGTIAFVISIFEFPIIPWVPFLKVDFSDIPIFFSMYIFGPSSGIAVAFIRSFLQYVRTGGDAGFPIGAIASFIASVTLTLPMYVALNNFKDKWLIKISSVIVATLSLTIVLAIINYLFILPAYMAVLNFPIHSIRDYLVTALLPFNLLKGVLVSSLILVLYAKMENWLKKMRIQMGTRSQKKDKVNFQNKFIL